MTKYILTVGLGIVAFLSVGSSVWAQGTDTVINAANTGSRQLIAPSGVNASPTLLPVRKMNVQVPLKARLDERCNTIENKLDATTSRFDNNKGRHVAQYQKLKTDFASLIRLLNSKGYDTTKLQADAKVLDEKILKFGRDYQAYVTQITKARQQACGESDGAFKSELEKARELLQIVQADSQDIRQYYQTVIKADIQAVRQQKATTTNM